MTATNWEIEFEFKISGAGTLYGDGMALWVTKERATIGPVFGSINKFDGLGEIQESIPFVYSLLTTLNRLVSGIFFDTYKNNRPGVIFPYVMAMIGDGKTEYNHNNDGKDQELAGCSVSPT